ncbi:MAG: amidohydrolase family protein [Steroidobacteraceae bacterium]|jgi:imidazolonepropionase-like amidohydrolase|nr:amidohydrolase family protein [Steroidobacteraceae bacterium]
MSPWSAALRAAAAATTLPLRLASARRVALATVLLCGVHLAVTARAAEGPQAAAPAAGPSPPASAVVSPPAAPVLKALVGGRVIDGTGAPPMDDGVILIRGERIEAVGTVGTLPIPPEAQVISTEGLAVLPGLWDLQVRLMRLGHADEARWHDAYLPLAERVVMPAAARELLLAGVTSARDVGSPLGAAVAVRNRIRERRIPGPTLWVAGPTLESAPPERTRTYRWAVATSADARARVEQLARAGVDYVLVADVDRLAPGVLEAAIAAARAAGLPVHAEVRRDADVERALAAGVDGLVGFGNGTGTEWPAAALAQLRSRAAAGRPVAWTAGVSALTNFEWLRVNREPLDEAGWKTNLAPLVVRDVRSSLVDLSAVLWYEMPAVRRPLVGPRLKSAAGGNARLVVGSDAGVPAHLLPRATWQEVEALVVEGGLTPLAAIRAATLEAATAMGAQRESGSLAPGKYADVIAVRGDPLRHIERLQDVEIVIRRGLRYR